MRSMESEACYQHVKAAWSLVLRRQMVLEVIEGEPAVVTMEITAETGCMTFALSRVQQAQFLSTAKERRINLCIGLLPCEQYVRVVDFSGEERRYFQIFQS